MDRAAAAAGEKAVLAELRAIGLSLAASTGVLRPVQAREVRGLAKRLVGSTDLLGQVFRWEGEDYLVNDIAPGPTQSGGQALKAYACCVKRRVASAGPLSEHNSAFDIRAVRDRIEKDRARGEATRLLGSLRPDAERREGEAGPSADPGPGLPPLRGESRARPPPTSGVDGRRVEPRLERPQGQGASPGAPPQELRRPAPPSGPPPPPPPPPPPLERPLGRGAAPEGPHQAVRPPVPPSFPPPALPLPPPPLERLQGRGAAPAAPHQAVGPRGPPPYPPPLPPPPTTCWSRFGIFFSVSKPSLPWQCARMSWSFSRLTTRVCSSRNSTVDRMAFPNWDFRVWAALLAIVISLNLGELRKEFLLLFYGGWPLVTLPL